jgi:hypothetical protein
MPNNTPREHSRLAHDIHECLLHTAVIILQRIRRNRIDLGSSGQRSAFVGMLSAFTPIASSDCRIHAPTWRVPVL